MGQTTHAAMASCKTFFQIAAFLTLILGLLLYHPLHEDLNDKALMRFAYGIDNIFKYVVRFFLYTVIPVHFVCHDHNFYTVDTHLHDSV